MKVKLILVALIAMLASALIVLSLYSVFLSPGAYNSAESPTMNYVEIVTQNNTLSMKITNPMNTDVSIRSVLFNGSTCTLLNSRPIPAHSVTPESCVFTGSVVTGHTYPVVVLLSDGSQFNNYVGT